MTSEKRIDLERAEGVYVSNEIYPPQGGPYACTLYTLERVNGDWTVDTLCVTANEARKIIAELSEQLAHQATAL